MAQRPRLEEADLQPTDDGLELVLPSGHVMGPFDPEELAFLLGDEPS